MNMTGDARVITTHITVAPLGTRPGTTALALILSR